MEHDFHTEQNKQKPEKYLLYFQNDAVVKQVLILVLGVVKMVLANRDIVSSGLRVPFRGCDKVPAV